MLTILTSMLLKVLIETLIKTLLGIMYFIYWKYPIWSSQAPVCLLLVNSLEMQVCGL